MIRNEYIRGTVKVEQKYVGRKMMEMELLEKRKEGDQREDF